MPGGGQTRSFPIPAVVPVPFPASPEPAGQGPVGLGDCGPPQRRVLGAGCPPRPAPLPPAQPCVIRHEKLAAALLLLKGWGRHHSLLFPCKQPSLYAQLQFSPLCFVPVAPEAPHSLPVPSSAEPSGGILPVAAPARHGAVWLQVGPRVGKETSFEPWPGSLLLLNFCVFCRQKRHRSASRTKWYFSFSQEKANSCPFSLSIAGTGYTDFIISSETAELAYMLRERDERVLRNCKICCQKRKTILKLCEPNTELSQVAKERSRDGKREQCFQYFPGSRLQPMPLPRSSSAVCANGDLRVAGADELAPALVTPLVHAAVMLPFSAGPGGACFYCIWKRIPAAGPKAASVAFLAFFQGGKRCWRSPL